MGQRTLTSALSESLPLAFLVGLHRISLGWRQSGSRKCWASSQLDADDSSRVL